MEQNSTYPVIMAHLKNQESILVKAQMTWTASTLTVYTSILVIAEYGCSGLTTWDRHWWH